ncbi:DUF262 domain-containing protein [Arthrobacter sp. NicSoilB11]|uniref:DUF262 domain-containing protein n=1 Tax=Arthrobacter sp. NicSoilB11 TaxID=2830999 RepID=UPI001CC3FD35|nr:DUF262 domain-containing protein [Arthrobacter sp. NicSoilB11]
MGKLTVESIGISELLDRLRSNAWLVPAFQRDFVWSEADVTSLALSVIEARPIGMATLWEQPDDSDLTLVPASIPDTQNGQSVDASLSSPEDRPKNFYAVLDGRQRATALAMVFGGLRATDARRRFSGRYFLDVSHDDPSGRVRYVREAQVKASKYDQLAVCIGDGLFPLSPEADKDLMGQWYTYIQAINDPSNYPDQALPEAEELARRNEILKQAFKGITETVLAVYIVPAEYTLGEICEIFETLNTTGTKVSTVDLLHSWLYNDTSSEPEPILLRDWIDNLGELEGAVGWASKSNRPEIIAQAVTACYVALDSEKPAPRAVGGKLKPTAVTSIKAGDLLATPAAFWKQAIENERDLANYVGDFQTCVAGGNFPLSDSPYPVTMAMYSALRWYMAHDSRYANQWNVEELNGLFRAFFWRNSLATRYDQGFLSQSSTDMRVLKEILFRRAKAGNANSWAAEANDQLQSSLELPVPDAASLKHQLLQAKPAGALGRALTLVVRTQPTQDLVNPNVSIAYPSSKPVDLHHLYPLNWCANNKHGKLGEILDPNKAEFDYAKSVANLTPLTRESNNTWRAKTPGLALTEKGVTFNSSKSRLESHFISAEAFAALTADEPDPLSFWESRAAEIEKDLRSRCNVQL